ncbi:MAG: hypothetical protein ACYC8T_22985 [Myxococcaceae bacterium]
MDRRRVVIGVLLGASAGVLDVIPMVLQKLTWDANLSAFGMWTVIGFILSTTALKLPPAVNGLVVAFLCLIPSAILIAWKEPFALVPISVMTAILGSLLGWSVDRFARPKTPAGKGR